MTSIRTGFAAALLATAMVVPVAATAQSAALESQRQVVFAQLLAAPADRALMMQYARLSVQMRDFEAAAAVRWSVSSTSTPTMQRRGWNWPRLISRSVPMRWPSTILRQPPRSGGLTREQAAEVARYREETEARQGPHQIAGRIALGQSWARETDQSGIFGTAQLGWRFDMGGPNAHVWLTQMAFSRYSPDEIGFDDRTTTRLRSGPEFRLTGDSYGPRLQPYLELVWIEEDDGFGFVRQDSSVALGFAYQNPHNAFWTSYADVQVGRGDRDSFGFVVDFDFREVSLGLTYRPSRETRIRGTLGWRDEDVDDGFSTYETSTTLRLEALHSFDTGWQALPRRWEARGWIQRENVEQGDSFGMFGDFTDTGYGLGLRAFMTDELFVEARGARLEREDSFGFATPETVYSLQIGWEF